MAMTLRTTDLPPDQRFAFWYEMATTAHVRTVIDKTSRDDFDASLVLHQFGAMQLTHLRYPSLRVRRTSRLIRQSDPEWLHLSLTTVGQVTLSQLGRTVTPETGTFVVYDTSRPCTVFNAVPVEQLVLQIPRSVLGRRTDVAETLLARPHSTRGGLGGTLAYILRDLMAHGAEHAPAVLAQLTLTVTDLISAILRAGRERTLSSDSRERICETRIHVHILERLSDPALTPAAVAQSHGLSLRQLSRVFAKHDASPAGWIRQARLERCRRDLMDPGCASHTVGAIGSRWGFPDPAAFSRVFSKAYGLPPGEFRRQFAAGRV